MATARSTSTEFRDQLKKDIAPAFDDKESKVAQTAFENLWQKLSESSIDQLEQVAKNFFINQWKVTPRQLLVLRQLPQLYHIACLRDQGISPDKIAVKRLEILQAVIKMQLNKIDGMDLTHLKEKAVYREAVNGLFLETARRNTLAVWNPEGVGRAESDSVFERTQQAERVKNKLLLERLQKQSEAKLEVDDEVKKEEVKKEEAKKEEAKKEEAKAEEKSEQAHQEKERIEKKRREKEHGATLQDIETTIEQAAQTLSQHNQQSQTNPVALASPVEEKPASVSIVTESKHQTPKPKRQEDDLDPEQKEAERIKREREERSSRAASSLAGALYGYALDDAKKNHAPAVQDGSVTVGLSFPTTHMLQKQDAKQANTQTKTKVITEATPLLQSKSSASFKAPSDTPLFAWSVATSGLGLAGGAFLVATLLSNPVGWLFLTACAGLAVCGALILGSALLFRNAFRRKEVASYVHQFDMDPGVHEPEVSEPELSVPEIVFNQNKKWRQEATCLTGLPRFRRMQLMAHAMVEDKTSDDKEIVEVKQAASRTKVFAGLEPDIKYPIRHFLNKRTGELRTKVDGSNFDKPVGRDIQKVYDEAVMVSRRLAGGG